MASCSPSTSPCARAAPPPVAGPPPPGPPPPPVGWGGAGNKGGPPGAPPPRRNVEIKARDADPTATLERALALGASDEGVLTQRDTYFGGVRGRLKLREEAGPPARAQLIAYTRPDGDQARTSAYRIAEVADPAGLREALDT